MECSDNTANITHTYASPPISSPKLISLNSCSSSRSPSPEYGRTNKNNPPIIVSPCAACKILRRRCVEKCVLAPYFPPTEPAKFTIAHRVFGASNIIKLLQELPESQRADAVSSMVYEAGARIRDPVYGCAGAISQLQKQVSDLQAQLAKAQAELVNMQLQQANLMAILLEMAHEQQPSHQFVDNFITSPSNYQANNLTILDDNNVSAWTESLWA